MTKEQVYLPLVCDTHQHVGFKTSGDVPCPWCEIARLRLEIDFLREDRDTWRRSCGDHVATIDQMRRAAEPSADAARYRWLRSESPEVHAFWQRAVREKSLTLDALDRAIDVLRPEGEPRADGIAFLQTWMHTPNPMLGNAVPLDLMKGGLGHRVAQFIEEAHEAESAPEKSS